MSFDTTFPTFCHVSEYGKAGYQHLHRMLAFSAPLNLWAPSSVMLRDACDLTTKQFIKFVESGMIRVLGREAWLTDRRFREGHPMGPAAGWVKDIDDVLQTILKEDERQPLSSRRVAVAPPETGTTWAKQYLADKPREVERWNRLFRSPNAREVLPVGTLEAVERHAGEGPEKIAEWILRNAYNHGEAAEFAEARVPLLLSSADRRFLKVLGESQVVKPRSGPRGSGKLTSEGELSVQLLEILQNLDVLGGPRNFDKFMSGTGRASLVAWMDKMCNSYQHIPPDRLDGAVLAKLREEIESPKVRPMLRDMLSNPILGSIGLVGFVLSAVESVREPDVLSLVGLAASTAPAGAFLGRHLGLAKAHYTGPQWPFLYAYRSLARKRQLKKLRYAVRQFD